MTSQHFGPGGGARRAIGPLSPKSRHRPPAPILIDPGLAFVHPLNVQALAYWRAKCASRAMPARSDLDPLDMRGFLPHVALVDIVVRPGLPHGYRIRLAGTAIEEVFGPISGRLLDEAVPAETAARWTKMFQATIDARAAIRVSTRVSYDRSDYLDVEAFFGPLADDGADISMLLVCAAFWVDPVPSPA